MKLSSARLDFENGRLDQALLRKYSETLGANAANAGSSYTVVITSGNVFYLILDSATCTMTFPTGTQAGSSFTLILRQDATGGRLVSWPTVKWPSNKTPVLSVLAGAINIFTFITTDSGTTWYAIPAGTEHVAFNDGLLGWGLGTSGQMGDNTATTKSAPVQVLSNTIGWSKISAGSAFAVGIKNDGTMFAWGLGTTGQLGQITAAASASSPLSVGTGKTWASVSAGGTHTAAITTAGALWGWGLGTGGQHGQVTSAATTSSPVQIASDKTWASVSAGVSHNVAITTTGQLWAWGLGTSGQLGLVTSAVSMSSPVQVASDKTWASVSAGDLHTVAVTTTGAIWAWGLGASGQLGQITGVANTSSPVQVASDKTWSIVAAGSSHTSALTTSSQLWAWGLGTGGQLGQVTSATSRSSPVQIASDKTWSAVAAGTSHTAAIVTTGQLWTWGGNGQGQLGDFTTASKSSPIQVGTSTKWIWVGSSGSNSTYALYNF